MTGYYIVVNGVRIDLPPGTVERGMAALANVPDEINTSEHVAHVANRNAEVAAELRAIAADVSMWTRKTEGGTVRLSLATLDGLRYRLDALAAKLAAAEKS